MNYHYFVITPLQYLNALEYRLSVDASNKKDNHILHIITDHKKRLNLLANIIDVKDWNEVNYEFNCDISRKKVFLYIEEVISRKKKLRRIKNSLNVEDQIILGSLTNTFCKYLHKCKAKSIFLDDGLATLLIKSKLKSPLFLPKKMNRFLETLIFNQFYFHHNPFILFSIFTVNHEKITLKKNELKHLKTRNSVNSKKIQNEVVFIGQPLVELNIVPSHVFTEYIEKVKAFYEKQGLKFSYLLHPGEKRDLKIEKWNLVSLDQPIETFYLNNENIPKIFSSFYSSANINLGIIFNNIIEQHFWKLNNDWLIRRYKIDFYKELQKQKFDFYTIKEIKDNTN